MGEARDGPGEEAMKNMAPDKLLSAQGFRTFTIFRNTVQYSLQSSKRAMAPLSQWCSPACSFRKYPVCSTLSTNKAGFLPSLSRGLYV